MILETDGYLELIQYLTEHLDLLSQKAPPELQGKQTLRSLLEEELATSIMAIHDQHAMNTEIRLEIIREADAVFYDLEEVLASALNIYPGPRQQNFITEFVGLVKNLFDTELNNK